MTPWTGELAAELRPWVQELLGFKVRFLLNFEILYQVGGIIHRGDKN